MIVAYKNKAHIKQFYLDRAEQHRAADEIIQGAGWLDGKGCCVGCLAHAYPAHQTLAKTTGIPLALMFLADTIHEGLPDPEFKSWPIRFVDAPRVGANLSLVQWQFLHWLLTDTAVNPGIEHPLVRDAVRQCADVMAEFAQGKGSKDAADAADAAWSAALSAVMGAVRGAARNAADAAWSAADAAESAASAASAAWIPADVAHAAHAAQGAIYAARSTTKSAYVLMADKLVSLMAEAA